MSYVDELIAQARDKQLADSKVWHTLVHYEPNLVFPGVHSLADDPDFFTASDGAWNPESELEATLRSFFSTDSMLEGQHPQCRFVARYFWLKQELGFDTARLKEQECTRFKELLEALDPQGVTLVFPAAYMNNPASMFGHTLLRIDAGGQDKDTRLLAYSASYAANTGQDGGIAFALKGLMGGYGGVYSIEPYYKRVKSYSDIENRDIWEYKLTLDHEESARVLMHLWELAHTDFTYYFFDENCAYYLLSLLEFARPSLRLSEQFPWYAIPSDTVFAAAAEEGLVSEVSYRPAAGTIIRHRIAELGRERGALAKRIAEGKIAPDGPELENTTEKQRARILELSSEILNYRIESGRAEGPQDGKLAHQLMRLRSKLGETVPPEPVPVPKVRPDQGHEVARTSLGGGYDSDRWFTELRLRPAYHDLMDPEGGYVRGAQINFFSLLFRYFEGDRYELDELIPLEIISLAPRDAFFTSISWKINGGLVRKRLDGDLGKYVGKLEGGPGIAYDLGGRLLLFGFMEGGFEASPRLDEDNYAVGAGPSAGALYDLTESLRLGLNGRILRYGIGDDHREYEAKAALRLSLGTNTAVTAELGRKGEFDTNWTSSLLSLHYFY